MDRTASGPIAGIRLCRERNLQKRGIVSALAAAVADGLRNRSRAMLVAAGRRGLPQSHQGLTLAGNRYRRERAQQNHREDAGTELGHPGNSMRPPV